MGGKDIAIESHESILSVIGNSSYLAVVVTSTCLVGVLV